MVVQKGSSPNATARLPLGDPLHDYAIALEIQILDSLGASTLEILVAMVCFILKRFVFYFGCHAFDLKLLRESASNFASFSMLFHLKVKRYPLQLQFIQANPWMRCQSLAGYPYALPPHFRGKINPQRGDISVSKKRLPVSLIKTCTKFSLYYESV